MNESESAGTSKGGLKDRLRVLAILIRIAKKKKLKLTFNEINTKKILNIRQAYLFFYKPIILVLERNLNVENVIIYDKNSVIENNVLDKSSITQNVDFDLIVKHKKKKGFFIEQVASEEISNKSERTIAEKEISVGPELPTKKEINIEIPIKKELNIEFELPIKKELNIESGLPIKKELSLKYNVQEENISSFLIADYLAISNNFYELFGVESDDKTRENLIADRIEAENDLILIKELSLNEKDFFLGADIDYELKINNESFVELNKLLEKQNQELEKITREINRFDTIITKKTEITNLGSLISNVIGIGVGILTLPFSSVRSFALGTKLIKNSLDNINKKVKFDTTETTAIKYRISFIDIQTYANALKTSDFLLKNILDKLDRLKYKIKLYDYKIPNYLDKLKEIEILETGLIIKKRKLNEMVENLEKNKIKVLKRNETQ